MPTISTTLVALSAIFACYVQLRSSFVAICSTQVFTDICRACYEYYFSSNYYRYDISYSEKESNDTVGIGNGTTNDVDDVSGGCSSASGSGGDIQKRNLLQLPMTMPAKSYSVSFYSQLSFSSFFTLSLRSSSFLSLPVTTTTTTSMSSSPAVEATEKSVSSSLVSS